MKNVSRIFASAWLSLALGTAFAQGKGVERLYILNCGEGPVGDVSRWSGLAADAGKSVPFAENCYLIKHAKGWFLWDTGITDAAADMPDGLKSPDPRGPHWYKQKKLSAQLEQLGVKPSDVIGLGISHTHPDHVGNVEMFATTMLYVQKAEYDWPDAKGGPRFKPGHPVTKLEGDRDVFGDGSLTLISTPGHTPGHQSLLVRLHKTGNVLLSGDAVHFKSNWDNRRVPSFNTDPDATKASMEKMAGILKREHAQLWINHDKPQRDTLKLSPAFYD